MLARLACLALASCAVALFLVVAVVACGGGQRPPAGVSASAGAADGGHRDGARDAPPPLFGGACPEDAPWTGLVCLGQGYVACPGGYSMDDRSRCVRDVPAVTAAAAAVAADAGDDDESD